MQFKTGIYCYILNKYIKIKEELIMTNNCQYNYRNSFAKGGETK